MNFKYLLGSIISLPLLPVLYFQGKKLRKEVPELPEAQGIEGFVSKREGATLKVLAIGESTMAGVGAKTHEEAFIGTLAKELAQKLNVNIHWKVYAKSGYTLKRVTHKILPQVEETNADLIVVGMGANNAFKLSSTSKWTKDVAELIKTIRVQFPKTPIAFINMPPIKDFPVFTSTMKFVMGNLVNLFGNELEKEVKNHDAVFFNSEKLSFDNWTERFGYKKDPALFFSDGVHPTVLTYQMWARDFSDFLVKEVPMSQTLEKVI